MEFKTYFVRSQRLAGFLMQKGFVLQGIKPSNDNSERNVFLFKNSEELCQRIQEYKANNRVTEIKQA